MSYQNRGIAARKPGWSMHPAIGVLVLTALFLLWPGQGWGEPGWQEDFARLCGGVETAAALTAEQLGGRVAECDRVLAVIRAEDAGKNKVEIFRLEKCRNFYEYLAKLKAGAEE